VTDLEGTDAYAILVIAGGRSVRFGADKLAILLDRVLESLPERATVVCVGPRRPVARADVRWTVESPPLSGPLAAVAAGVAALQVAGDASPATVVLVGGDMPSVGRAVPALVAAIGRADGAVLLDEESRPQPLASAWRVSALSTQLARIGDPAGRPLRHLLLGTSFVTIPDRWAAARDIDRPDDLRAGPGGSTYASD